MGGLSRDNISWLGEMDRGCEGFTLALASHRLPLSGEKGRLIFPPVLEVSITQTKLKTGAEIDEFKL